MVEEDELASEDGVERAIERARGLEGQERRSALLAIAESLAARGEAARALAVSRELVLNSSYDDRALVVLEELAEAVGDMEMLQSIAHRRVAVAPDRDRRAQAFEAFAEHLLTRENDSAGAAKQLMYAAEQWFREPEDYAQASRLYWKAFELAPAPGDAWLAPENELLAWNLLELGIARKDWDKLPLAFRAVLATGVERSEVVRRLLSLEVRMTQALAYGAFARAVDEVLSKVADTDGASARTLLDAKKRALAGFL